MNIAVVLAGGVGARVGGAVPKQLLPLADGRSVLEHSVEAFEHADCIDEVCVVMHPDYMATVEEMIAKNGWQKVKHVISGGKERWESSVNAIRLYRERLLDRELAEANILLHDAARPFVSSKIISDVCSALVEHEAVVVAVPSTDTVYEMQDGCVARIPNRSTIMRAQTPQAFRLLLISEAYNEELGIRNEELEWGNGVKVTATDDCGIVHKNLPNTAIHIVFGEEQNKKITFKEDI